LRRVLRRRRGRALGGAGVSKDPLMAGRTAPRLRRWARWVLVVAGFVLAVAVVWSKRDEVAAAGTDITNVHAEWVFGAIALEAVALIAFAQLQRTLLRAGQVD